MTRKASPCVAAWLAGTPTSLPKSLEYQRLSVRRPCWEGRGLSIYRIPPYSPELNLIERFWQKLKYQWMPTTAWDEFADMLDAAIECIEQRGRAYLMPSLQH